MNAPEGGVDAPEGAEAPGSKRSDRWAASGRPGNPWAWASVCFGFLGLASVGVIVAATLGVRTLDAIPDGAGYGLYAAVPSCGALAVFAGVAGRRRERRRWLAWIGVGVGSLLVLAALVAVAIVVDALRTLGAGHV